MHDPKQQIEDVNHFDNTIVVKFQDGTITLLKGDVVRHADDVNRTAGAHPPDADPVPSPS